MKGQLFLQGQKDSCLEAEKLALCLKGGKGRQGKQMETLLSSSLAWPVLTMVGLELRGWGGPRDRACLPAAGCIPHRKASRGAGAVIIILVLLFFLAGGTSGRF